MNIIKAHFKQQLWGVRIADKFKAWFNYVQYRFEAVVRIIFGSEVKNKQSTTTQLTSRADKLVLLRKRMFMKSSSKNLTNVEQE